ncbi:MAG: glycosyltransferase family 2 protein [Ruminococcaceae bacterium]|nr:glycosyltransferase family 2 protein [Oscillospiraceae bacterium]
MNNTILEKKPLVSVYTCVYNGEKTLHRVFNSVKNLNYPNIEHVIINDGSTDKTDSLITEYISQVSYPVKYHKKSNGGKHTALNIAWDIAEGEFAIQLDADDELLPDCINMLVSEYYQIPEETRDQYFCVNGRCRTQHGDFVGLPYPDGINELSWEDAKKASAKCRGDKISLYVLKLLRPYKLPEVPCVKFLPEAIIWKQMNLKYRTRYTNEVGLIYYVNEGGSLTSKSKSRRHYNAFTYNYKWKIIHPELYKKSFKLLFRYSVGFFISDKEYQTKNKYFDEITNTKDKLILSVLCPFTMPAAFFYRLIKGIK